MNFKEKLAKLGFLIAVGIFILGIMILIIGIAGKNSTHNIYFIGTGILIITPYTIYFFIEFLKSKNEEKKIDLIKLKNIDKLKTNGYKLLIDLDKVNIESKLNSKKRIVGAETYNGIGRNLNEGYINEKTEISHFNNIQIKIKHRGKYITHRAAIDMDADKLKIHFAIQKVTYLY